MPSPFPGMDPYLESPDWFPCLHDGLIFGILESGFRGVFDRRGFASRQVFSAMRKIAPPSATSTRSRAVPANAFDRRCGIAHFAHELPVVLPDILAAVDPRDGRRADSQMRAIDVEVGTGRGLGEAGQLADRSRLGGFETRAPAGRTERRRARLHGHLGTWRSRSHCPGHSRDSPRRIDCRAAEA